MQYTVLEFDSKKKMLWANEIYCPEALEFSKDSRSFYSVDLLDEGGPNRALVKRDSLNEEVIFDYSQNQKESLYSLELGPQEKYIYPGGSGKIKKWEESTEKLVLVTPNISDEWGFVDIKVSRDSKNIFTISENSMLFVMDLDLKIIQSMDDSSKKRFLTFVYEQPNGNLVSALAVTF